MTYKQYQALARRTESISGVQNENMESFRLIHMQFGLTTEIIEFKNSEDEANDVEELGDIFWYLDGACDVFGVDIDKLFRVRHKDLEAVDLMLYGLGEFTDLLKRRYYYRLDDAAFRNKALHALSLIDTGLSDIIVECDYNISDILEKNIEKLRIRMPGKFEGVQFVDRDLEKERSVFE